MSYDNYVKNKARAEWLYSSQVNLATNKKLLKWGERYECHCRCCEDIFFDHIDALVARGYLCKCGSCRLGIFHTKEARGLINDRSNTITRK